MLQQRDGASAGGQALVPLTCKAETRGAVPTRTRATDRFARFARQLEHVLVSVILRITAQPVLPQYFRTVVDGPQNYRNVRGAGWEPRRGTTVPQGATPAGYPGPHGAITASNR